uniref:Uncharacterized protein n=1 Tax=Nomascus leucogenys TaxID=61853 RepID=A0A2I3HD57_NOMLE
MLVRLVSNSRPQVIRPPRPPKVYLSLCFAFPFLFLSSFRPLERSVPEVLLLFRPREERGSSCQPPTFSYFRTVVLLRGPISHLEYQVPHFWGCW